MLQPIIEAISGFATLLAQWAVAYIAAHSNLKKDGAGLYLVKVIVSVFVYLAIITGIPLTVILFVVLRRLYCEFFLNARESDSINLPIK